MEINKAIKILKDRLEKDKVFTDKHYLSLYSFDSTNIYVEPDAVIFPSCEEDVVNVVRVASEFRIPVVARGSGTSRSGGALPVKGGFLISFTKMNRIKEIDSLNMCAVVEPGVITQDLNIEASKFGLYYPPDPSSVKVSTIGGNISHNAGGIHAVKYGVTKNYLLGMRAVTIDGRVLRLGGKVLKSVVGYDLMRLIAGSEGTLAIITEATLRLIPKPIKRALFMLPFADEYGWIEIISKIYQTGILPCSLEFMDRECISVNKRIADIESFKGREISSILFIELDGNDSSVEYEKGKVEMLLSESGFKSYLFSDDREEIEAIWDIRRDISPSLNELGRFRIADDVSVPLSNLMDAIKELRDFAEENNYKIAVFGHAGDSNLHINYMFETEEEMNRSFSKVMRRITEVILKKGGSISGEHGVGILKRDFSELELDGNAVLLMKEIKKIFDPHNLLNPDKIFKSD
ncbi:MAG: FAD-binding oxidoreductase [Myxococcota bacterium]